MVRTRRRRDVEPRQPAAGPIILSDSDLDL